MTVEDIRGDHRWKWELLSFDLPDSIKDKIKLKTMAIGRIP